MPLPMLEIALNHIGSTAVANKPIVLKCPSTKEVLPLTPFFLPRNAGGQCARNLNLGALGNGGFQTDPRQAGHFDSRDF